MRILFLLTFISLIIFTASQGYRKSKTVTPVIKNPIKEIPINVLPANYTWSNMNGTNYLTLIRNQHIPSYCGGCWAFAASAVLSDRIKIKRNAAWPDITLSPQVLLSCEKHSQGCDGGDSLTAFEYIYNRSITDETCSPYQARGNTNGLGCSSEIICGSCNSFGQCTVPESYLYYEVDEFGPVHGEEAMMNEIYQNGPISCGINALGLTNYSGGILVSHMNNDNINHEVSVVGWGVAQNGSLPYWIVRNSWGSWWGEYGFFRIVRGIDNLGIESACAWATPKDTWTESKRIFSAMNEPTEQKTPKKSEGGFLSFLNKIEDMLIKEVHPSNQPSSLNSNSSNNSVYTPCYIPSKKYNRTFNIETSHLKDFDFSSLPASFDWRNPNGTSRNYLTWTKTQSSPNYCASCWAQAATSVIADRINILRNNSNITLGISPQAIINCGAGGNCTGGDPFGVYEWAVNNSIPEDSCTNYQAIDPTVEGCSPIQLCRDCIPPAPPAGYDFEWDCSPVVTYPDYSVSAYGPVNGSLNMMAEIFLNGPITCAMQVTPGFSNYTEGIYSETVQEIQLNHIVAIVGWEFDPDTELQYWIGRNSWGSYWGEFGYFKILAGQNILGIEQDCSWAIPYEKNVNGQSLSHSKLINDLEYLRK